LLPAQEGRALFPCIKRALLTDISSCQQVAPENENRTHSAGTADWQPPAIPLRSEASSLRKSQPEVNRTRGWSIVENLLHCYAQRKTWAFEGLFIVIIKFFK